MYSHFEKMVINLLDLIRSQLTNDNIENIEDLIAHNESGVAYETIVPLIYEYKIPLTKESYQLVTEIGQAMKKKESYWLILRDLIIETG